MASFTGTSSTNTLTGTSGDDTIDGLGGADSMTGLAGDDVYIVDNAKDIIFENFNEGADTVRSSVTHTLAANVEALVLTGTAGNAGTGNVLDNTITGNTGNNKLFGLDGSDTLDGGAGNDTLDGGAGADSMIGGIGNDIFIADNAADVIFENPGGGTDLVQASASFSIAAFADVENLTLTGTASNNATGNALNNTITGNAGDNRIDGGAGADKMTGGAGNDTYVVDNTGDVISDASGVDTVESSVSYTIGTGIEKLVLTGVGVISGTGNTSANSLVGNDAANFLNGGRGNDVMEGGLGDDTYVVDAVLDVVTEQAMAGTDTVLSSVTYTLGTNVENLTLTGTGGIHATGNAGINILTGNGGANTLNGGLGADTLIGGAGKDTYVIDDAGDVIQENSVLATETDTVLSSIDYTLGANLENVTLTAAGHTATGNALNNTMNGSAGDDVLNGAAGKDKITANAGNDTIDGGTGSDVITGNDGDDRIIVDMRADVFNAGKRVDIDTLDGGNGNDTLVLHLSNAQGADAGIQSAIVALQAAIDAGNTRAFTSTALGLKVTSFSSLQVITDSSAGSAPTDITLDNASVNENAVAGVIGNLAAIDPDVGETHTFTVNDSRFEIVGSQLKLKAGQSLDFESAPTVTLHITATDQGGLSFSKDIVVTVNNVNEAPTNITLGSATVNENAVAAVIGSLTVTDPDATDTHTFTVDDSRFEVVSGQLQLKAGQSINFEAEPSVTVHVTATDAGGLSFSKDFTITVANVNEAPTNISLGSATVNENAIAAAIGALTVTDSDAANTHSFTVNDNRFEVVSGQLKLKAGQSLNFEAEPSVTVHVTATDQGGLSFAKDFVITVSNVNEAPTNITLSNASVGGGVPAANVGTLTVTDPDAGDTHSFTVDDSRFEVVSGQLKLKAGQSLDEVTEPTVTVHVTATDAGSLSFAKDFTISVHNGNSAPTDISISNASVSENATAAVIGTLTVTDPDAGDTYSFTVDDSRFEVVSGQLKLKAGQSLDFETEPSVTVHVTATDAGSLSFGKDFTITVNNVNEAPTNISLGSASVNENAVAAIIGTLTVTDPDAGNTHSFAVDDSRFEVVSGQLKLKAGQSLDYEAAHTVTVHVTATDQGSLSFGKDFIVTVVDQPDAALFTAGGDNIDFNLLSAGVYGAASFYDALGGNDVVYLPEAAKAALLGYSYANTFSGSGGNDTISGSAQNDIINGGIGNDNIYGADGSDTLETGGGNDTLVGENGGDTYIFVAGDGTGGGAHVVENTGATGTDTIAFQGVDPATVRMFMSGLDLVVQYGSFDQFIVTGQFDDASLIGQQIERITFDDAGHTVWDLTQGLYMHNNDTDHSMLGSNLADTLLGGAGSDTISGFRGDDTIESGGGSDQLVGGDGSDTYVFRAGDATGGVPAIFESPSGTGTNTISFIGIDPANVRMWTSGLDTVIQYGAFDQFKVSGTTNDDNTLIDVIGRITFDDAGHTVWDQTQGLYMHNNDVGHVMQGSRLGDTLIGGTGNDTIIGNDGDDTIESGGGSDSIGGGDGSDVYVFRAGDAAGGVPAIFEFTSGTGTNTISFIGIDPANVHMWTSGLDTIIQYGAFDQFKVSGTTNDDNTLVDMIGHITFDDAGGTDWDQTQGLYMHNNDVGHEMQGSRFNDTLIGGAGSDTIIGNGGDDTLDGGTGADAMGGGAGDDFYFYDNAGDTVVEVNGFGFDTLYATVNYTLAGQSIERLIIDGAGHVGTGDANNNTIEAYGGSNTLFGNGGNDYLYSSDPDATLDGGTGADTMSAKFGTYYVDNAGDVINEQNDTATVYTSVDYNATYSGYIYLLGTGNLNATGSAGTVNIIVGNAGNNTLDDGGAAILNNPDFLAGGGGNNTFIVSGNGTYIDTTGDGNDILYASAQYQETGSGPGFKNVFLSGSANISAGGSNADNTIIGNAGNNSLYGFEGKDTIQGLGGDDYIESYGTDGTLDGGDGDDIINAGFDSSGNTLLGGEGNDQLYGDDDNTLYGGNGNDTLDGGAGMADGGAGDDTLYGLDVGGETLIGGSGDDSYYLRFLSDGTAPMIVESAGGGTDTVYIDDQSDYSNYILPDNVENLVLDSFVGGPGRVASGNAGDNTITGSVSADVLSGLDGNDKLIGGDDNDTLDGGNGADTLDGGDGNDRLDGGIGNDVLTGGLGNDTLTGGAGTNTLHGGDGNDLYIVSSSTDVIDDSDGSGTVQSSVSYTLPADIQSIVLTGTADINATGNAQDNTLTGNSGNNTLDGGAGADTMAGGLGNDFYGIDDTGDKVNDTTGTDWLIVTVDHYNMQANASGVHNVELFATYGDGSNLADFIVGDSNTNVILGNDGNDTLAGMDGDDTLSGGNGVDTLDGGNNNDLLLGDAGTDTLTGGGGADTLDGGDGNDFLQGDAGADVFVFMAATVLGNVDTIADFNSGAGGDVIDLRDVLTGYHPGTDVLTDFVQITDSGSDSILSIDPDGAGSTYGMTQIALIVGKTGLTDEAALVAAGHLVVS